MTDNEPAEAPTEPVEAPDEAPAPVAPDEGEGAPGGDTEGGAETPADDG